MYVNAAEETYEHIEIFKKPALFTNSRISRATVPNGWYCYDIRGSDSDPGSLSTIENKVGVNHAGTVLAPNRIAFSDGKGYRRIRGNINFMGDKLSLKEFCENYSLPYPCDKPIFVIRPAFAEESGLFFALPTEQDEELGAIGHVRIDFGQDGDKFWTTWHPRGPENLNSAEFRKDLDTVVNELRNSVLKDLRTMTTFCRENGGEISGGRKQNYGYIMETENYRYCLRCNPVRGDYQAYLTAFDKRVQEMNQEQAPESSMKMDGMC